MKKIDYKNRIESLKEDLRNFGAGYQFETPDKPDYFHKQKALWQRITDSVNKMYSEKAFGPGRIKKADVEELTKIEIKTSILKNALEQHLNHISILRRREINKKIENGNYNFGNREESLMEIEMNTKLTGSKTVNRIEKCQLLGKQFSKSTASCYLLYKVGNRLVQVRKSDHFNERGSISVSLVKLGNPIKKNTLILEERYNRIGVVENSDEYVTTVNYKGDVEVYNTFYANWRTIS